MNFSRNRQLLAFSSSLIRQPRRWKNAVYKPAGGLKTFDDVEKIKEVAAKADEDPMNFTIFGNPREPKQDVFFYTNRKAGKGYSDYSTEVYANRPYIFPPVRKYFKWNFYLLFALIGIFFIDPERITHVFDGTEFGPRAATVTHDAQENSDDGSSDSSSSGEATDRAEGACDILPSEKPKKKKRGFRDRRVIQYENRLRSYSHPDKIFRYFATLKIPKDDNTYEVFMTPEDFVRSITPNVMQPRRLGLDKFKIFNPDKHKSTFTDPDCLFHRLSNYGLICYTDYLFLMTLLSTSPSDFRLAFAIFDVNGDGFLDREEFAKVQKLLLSQTYVGLKHRDHKMGNSNFTWSPNSVITRFLFAEQEDGKLSVETFLQFQKDLHRDILKIEFERRDPETNPVGIISEVSFAELLLMHAGLDEKKQKRMLKRVKKAFKPLSSFPGISFDEVNAFFHFIYHIDMIDMALHFYKLAGKPLSKQLIIRVANKVADIDLSDHIVDVVITLFDENCDGELSHREFIAIMKKRMQRGLEKPKDTGFMRYMDALWACAAKQLSAFIEA